ncbi:hypothetical protein ABZ725_37850 [Streptomyces sp. NPDC006872]|uniref:hypothetical protein n=1 Tax=Streptomyces sp. NPDC006872 TaxID=3155720 RepID=UPI003410094C
MPSACSADTWIAPGLINVKDVLEGLAVEKSTHVFVGTPVSVVDTPALIDEAYDAT